MHGFGYRALLSSIVAAFLALTAAAALGQDPPAEASGEGTDGPAIAVVPDVAEGSASAATAGVEGSGASPGEGSAEPAPLPPPPRAEVVGHASYGVRMALAPARRGVAVAAAAWAVGEAVTPAAIQTESEAARRMRWRRAMGAASAASRDGVEVGRVEAWITHATRELERRRLEHETSLERSRARAATGRDAIDAIADATTPTDLDRLYTSLVDELVGERAELRAALDAFGTPAGLPTPLRRPLPDDIAERFTDVARRKVETETLVETARSATRDEREQRVDAAADAVLALNHARLAALPALSRSARETLLGLGSEGLAQLGREVGHVALMSRWYRHDRSERIGHLGDWAVGLLTVASTRGVVARMLLCALAFGLLVARRKAVVRLVLGEATGQPTPSAALARRAVPELAAFGLGALLLHDLDAIAPAAEAGVLREVGMLSLGIRAALVCTHATLIWAAESALVHVSQHTSDRLLRSLRIIARFTAAVWIYLALAEAIVGHGYLYRLVRQLAWLGAFPIAWWLMRHWRDDVLAGYERRVPNGRLLPLIRWAGTSPVRTLIVPLAAVPLAIRTSTASARALAFRFERSRRALSYLFQRRLERRSAALESAASFEPLSPERRSALCAKIDADEVALAWEPQRETLGRVLARFRSGHRGATVLVVGERGIGKSAMLAWARERANGTPVVEFMPDPTCQTEAGLAAALAGVLGVDAPARLADLEAPLSQTRRVVLIDDLQRLVRRTDGGFATLEAFVSLATRTTPSVLWIATVGAHAWSWLRFASAGRTLFEQVIELTPWSDTAIIALIRRRMDALGTQEIYDDLLETEVAGEAREYLLNEVRENYLRLARDYADGIPDAALQFWANSLVEDPSGGLRVRPFDAPMADDLESLDHDARFVLGAVVMQIELETSLLPAVTSLPPARAELALDALLARGVLARAGDLVWVDDAWQRAAVAYVRRKNLVPG
jgi:hypothetical protein